MSVKILEAIEKAVPGITDGAQRYTRPRWVDRLVADTEVWLGGYTITRADVTVNRRADVLEVERLVVSAIADEAVVAQATITFDPEREDGGGRFGGWKIVRLRTITDLTWTTQKVGMRELPQVTATFSSLPAPVTIPGDIQAPIDLVVLTSVFRTLRDAWVDSGSAEVSASTPT